MWNEKETYHDGGCKPKVSSSSLLHSSMAYMSTSWWWESWVQCHLHGKCYDFPLTLTISRVTHIGLSDWWLLYAYLLSVPSWWPSPFMYKYLLSYDELPLYLYRISLTVFSSPHVYKHPAVRPRNSKQVLFCTNTSRRRTCLFLYLCTTILGEYPIPNLLSPEMIALRLWLSNTRDDYA